MKSEVRDVLRAFFVAVLLNPQSSHFTARKFTADGKDSLNRMFLHTCFLSVQRALHNPYSYAQRFMLSLQSEKEICKI